MNENKMNESGNEKDEIKQQSNWKSVYIMKSEYGKVKIGISNNVGKRKKTIENNRMIKIVNVYKTKPCSNSFEIEKEMHEYFANWKIHGEWFSCDMKDAVSILNKMFARMAKFDIKNCDLLLNPIMEYRNKKVKEEQDYIESLENTVDMLQGFVESRDEIIEKLISMVENLQSEIKIKNEELEGYYLRNEQEHKKRFDEAAEYAKNWKPCTNTIMMISDCNAQLNVG